MDDLSYHLKIEKNIEENKRVLQSLGLSFGSLCPPTKKVSKPNNIKKPSSKSQSQNSVVQEELQLNRRRTRHSSILQSIEIEDDLVYVSDTINNEENTPPFKKTKFEPVFGEIRGVRVGDWWPTRIDCSAAGAHRPTVAGIHGKQGEGCYSIALSGGYEDDVDCGSFFTYTGSGGRDLKGTKSNPKNLRTAPQSKDQAFDGVNAALALNVETGKPVRVIRGYKLESDFAPEEGYRYDGLYSVEKFWTATGLSGFKVFKFALKRLTNQDPPPWECCDEIVPILPNEYPPPAEENMNNAHTDNMNTNNSISALSNYTSTLPPQISERDRPRKQKTPQRLQINPVTVAQDFLDEFQKELEDNSEIKKARLSEETLKSTENLTFNSRHSVPIENNVDITPLQKKNPMFLKDVKLVTDITIPHCTLKNVMISPITLNTNGLDSQCIHELEFKVGGASDNEDLHTNSYSDGKRQSTILNYFFPVKKSVENQTSKIVVNPKSLRSNRFSSFGLHSGIPKSLNNNVASYDTPTETIVKNGCYSNGKKLVGMTNIENEFPYKQKYKSSLSKKREFNQDLSTLPKTGPSVMENLIKQNNAKLQLQYQTNSRKRAHPSTLELCSYLSCTKPCTVVLNRIKIQNYYLNTSDFLGWDLGNEGEFCGFSEKDLTLAQDTKSHLDKVKNISFINTQNCLYKQLNDGFQGWNVNRDEFQGPSDLVPIGFIIEKLSRS